MMKTVGIIGGLGPETTANFYMNLIRLGQAMASNERPPVLIWSVPIPYEVEKSCIRDGRGSKSMLPLLIDGATRLVRGGAELLVMPCNSLHIFISEIRRAAGVPVLSIIEETASWAGRNTPKKVGLLGTSIVLEAGMYEKSLRGYGIHCAVPSPLNQQKLQEVIFKTINDHQDEGSVDVVASITQDFQEQGIEHVILACTDLHLFFPAQGKLRVIDSMLVLAHAAIREIFSVSTSGPE